MHSTEKFIIEHRTEDVRLLALQAGRFPGVQMPYALDQIAGWQTALSKLPSWAERDGIVYPPHLSMEQCSSEQTASYKAEVASRVSQGATMVDLTGGFGVDFSFMAKHFTHATYVERMPHLCEIAEKNFHLLNLSHAQVINADGEEVLKNMEAVDLIYLDPARRDNSGGRTYALEDCTPNVLELRELLLQKAPVVMIKLSPMLDWHKVVSDLKTVSEVHIVSIKNECKELVVVLKREASSPTVYCVNDGSALAFCEGDNNEEIYTKKPLCDCNFLYEPNSSIMKAGFFGALCQRLGVEKIAPHSNLFTSDETVDFSGRAFRIERVSTMNKRDLKDAFGHITKANIAVRNFPLTAVELRKKLKLKDGGEHYIFGTTDYSGTHILLLCHKI